MSSSIVGTLYTIIIYYYATRISRSSIYNICSAVGFIFIWGTEIKIHYNLLLKEVLVPVPQTNPNVNGFVNHKAIYYNIISTWFYSVRNIRKTWYLLYYT